MKKTFIILTLATSLVACKKSTNTATTNNTSKDSTIIVGKYGNGVTDIEGNKYKTVIIGTQEWMGENLKVSKFNDGTSIPNVKDSSVWVKLITGAWCNYDNNDSLGKVYGKLYNWYAVSKNTNGDKNVCPTGWHVPIDDEWNVLVDYLGGEIIAGGKMKGVDNKMWDTLATNTSFFTALPGGARFDYTYEYYNFHQIGYIGAWWSSSEYIPEFAKNRNIYIGNSIAFLYNIGRKSSGLSVRCIKD